MHTFLFPIRLFQQILHQLQENANHSAFVPVGWRGMASAREWYAQRVLPEAPLMTPARRQPYFQITQTTLSDKTGSAVADGSAIGYLQLMRTPVGLQLRGDINEQGRRVPLDWLYLIGPGMHHIPMKGMGYLPPKTPLPESPDPEIGVTEAAPERWSRTIAGLGGMVAWQRLAALPTAIIGCGRTGSLVATTLASLGLRHLILIDPAVVEPHNLGEMALANELNLGQPKVNVIAAALRQRLPVSPPDISPVAVSVIAEAGRKAALRARVVFCCVDNDTARLAVATLATTCHQVLVDIGTGIFARQGQPADARVHLDMSLDVRLIVPGDGCLLCYGGLSEYEQAVTALTLASFPWQRPARTEIWQQAGSLRTLNQLAAALGVQMLQDLVSERLPGSTWVHGEFDQQGQLALRYVNTNNSSRFPDCPLCERTGMGDTDSSDWLE